MDDTTRALLARLCVCATHIPVPDSLLDDEWAGKRSVFYQYALQQLVLSGYVEDLWPDPAVSLRVPAPSLNQLEIDSAQLEVANAIARRGIEGRLDQGEGEPVERDRLVIHARHLIPQIAAPSFRQLRALVSTLAARLAFCDDHLSLAKELAVEAWETALTLADDADRELHVQIADVRARIAVRLGLYSEAEYWFRRALDIVPQPVDDESNLDSLRGLIQALTGQERYEEVVTIVNSAVTAAGSQNRPMLTRLLATASQAMALAGDPARAGRLIDESLPELRDHMGPDELACILHDRALLARCCDDLLMERRLLDEVIELAIAHEIREPVHMFARYHRAQVRAPHDLAGAQGDLTLAIRQFASASLPPDLGTDFAASLSALASTLGVPRPSELHA